MEKKRMNDGDYLKYSFIASMVNSQVVPQHA